LGPRAVLDTVVKRKIPSLHRDYERYSDNIYERIYIGRVEHVDIAGEGRWQKTEN
jgi:hypothetical protein